MNQIITGGLKIQITEVWLAVLESKVVRSDKLDHYMEQIFEAMRVKRYWATPLAGEEVPVISVDEAKDSRGMIMDVTLAVTERLSENQLKRIKSSSSFGSKGDLKRQYDFLLRGTRALANGFSGATGGADWANSKTFHTEEWDTEYEDDVYLRMVQVGLQRNSSVLVTVTIL